jgi:hypothetical protein
MAPERHLDQCALWLKHALQRFALKFRKLDRCLPADKLGNPSPTLRRPRT